MALGSILSLTLKLGDGALVVSTFVVSMKPDVWSLKIKDGDCRIFFVVFTFGWIFIIELSCIFAECGVLASDPSVLDIKAGVFCVWGQPGL